MMVLGLWLPLTGWAVEPAAPVVTPAEEVPDLTAQDVPVAAEVPKPESEPEVPEPAEVQTAAPAPTWMHS